MVNYRKLDTEYRKQQIQEYKENIKNIILNDEYLYKKVTQIYGAIK